MVDEREQAQEYQRLVVAYEETGRQIQSLMDKYRGRTEEMSPTDMQLYRQLAAQRDDLYNQIKAIEAAWFAED